ncbi:hypothetical protein ACFFV8_06150 [Sphingobium indicum]|uniref:hypothetical protein n=1 Tax=Sphingobium TaxID=165695 RepID=UPI0003878D05|nr:hypothetical protein [Sphingobium sp. HDIP04]EQA96696.1 hypothetical protein L286_23985 [Sphingobium sp. HDIP04]
MKGEVRIILSSMPPVLHLFMTRGSTKFLEETSTALHKMIEKIKYFFFISAKNQDRLPCCAAKWQLISAHVALRILQAARMADF